MRKTLIYILLIAGLSSTAVLASPLTSPCENLEGKWEGYLVFASGTKTTGIELTIQKAEDNGSINGSLVIDGETTYTLQNSVCNVENGEITFLSIDTESNFGFDVEGFDHSADPTELSQCVNEIRGIKNCSMGKSSLLP